MAVLNTSKRGCTTLWMVPECPVCQMPSTGAFCSLEFMSFMLQRSLCQLYKLCKFVHELIMSDVSDPNVWLKLAIDPINHNLIAWIKQVCKHRSCCHCYDLSGKPASNLAGIDNSKLKIEGQEVFNKSSTEPSRCTFKPHTFSCFFPTLCWSEKVLLFRKQWFQNADSIQISDVPEVFTKKRPKLGLQTMRCWCWYWLMLLGLLKFFIYKVLKRRCRIGPPTTVLLSWNQRMRISFFG